MISSSWPLGNQVGCDTTLNELLPNGSILIFNDVKISKFSLTIINSPTGNSIMIGINGDMISLLGWDNR